MEKKISIGLDFDNTIAGYDHLFQQIASLKGWINDPKSFSKQQVRDAVRLLESGEERWQILQAEVYGPRMSDAYLTNGFEEFLLRCHQRGADLCVISHKTQHAKFGSKDINLRNAALRWMNDQGLITRQGPGLHPEAIYFAETRKEKIAIISNRKCSYFVDDLIEVLMDADFPTQTIPIHFSPGDNQKSIWPSPSYKNWQEVGDAIFQP